MNLNRAIEQLYDLLALDKTIAEEVLKELVQDEAICFILSISGYYTRNSLGITRGGQDANIEYQLGKLIYHISSNNVTFNSYFSTLDIKTQVVLKEILSSKSKYSSTIFYAHSAMVFTKAQILRQLQTTQATESELKYLVLDSPKFYYKTKSYKLIYNTVRKLFKHQIPMSNQTLMYDNEGTTIASGGVSLGNYLHGKGGLGEIEGNFKKAKSITEIQYKLNRIPSEKSVLVFHPDGIIVLNKEKVKVTCDIIDLILSDEFEVIGIYFNYKGNSYNLLCDVPQTVFDRGVDMYEVVVKLNELTSGINNLEFVQLKLKEI